MKRPISVPSIVQVMSDTRLFEPMYSGPSWDGWKCVLKAAFGLPMSAEEIAFFKLVAGDRDPSGRRCKELVLAIGRRGGKDAVTALICAYAAMTYKPDGRVRAGERPLILLLAADKSQARNLLRYIRGLFEVARLKALITRETADGFELANGCDVWVGTSDAVSVRGRTVLLCCLNELSFWSGENSSNPDKEIYRAILPATASLGHRAMIVMISSVHRRGGLLYERFSKFFGKDDPNTLVIRGGTRQFNPTIDQEIIDEALAADPQSAAAEYLSEWRDDLSSYIDRATIEACVDKGVTVRPPQAGIKFVGFIDASSGRSDSYCCAITSRDGDIGILHCVVEIPAPCDPVNATAQIAMVLRSYGIKEVWGDRYAVGFVSSELNRHGLTLQHSGKSRSDLYRELLPALRSRRVRLLDDERAISQFASLERRALPAGSERIDHPAYGNAKDDVSNSIAGALVMLAEPASGAENWIEFYRRQVEEPNRLNTDVDDVRAAGPNFGFSFSAEPLVKVIVPPVIAAGGVVHTPSATHSISIRYSGREGYAEMSRADAACLLKANSVWRELNSVLAREILGETVI